MAYKYRDRREYMRKWYAKNKERERARCRKWRQSESAREYFRKNKEKIKAYEKERAERDKEKFSARSKARYAIKVGKIIKTPCEFCGDEDVHAHHEDYSKPLEVRFLCQKHHAEVHYGKA